MLDRFLRAARGESVDRVPVWFMRQAGRYQPEYRELRKHHDILDLIRRPELAAEVTVRPVAQLGVDAAILFSDIMVVLGPMGVAYEIKEGIGPVVVRPVRAPADIERLGPLRGSEGLEFVGEAIQRIRERIEVPLIGFSGAPFTLASYLIEGGPSRQYLETKRLLWADRPLWDRLMIMLADAVIDYATLQVKAGAQAFQLFDSWAGALSRPDFDQAVRPYLARIVGALRPLSVPVIYFAVGSGHLLPSVASLGFDVIGLDWRQSFAEARRAHPDVKAWQGNLDPAVLAAPWPAVRRGADRSLHDGGGVRRIFNLGHGVLPSTDPAVLRKLVDFVHGWQG